MNIPLSFPIFCMLFFFVCILFILVGISVSLGLDQSMNPEWPSLLTAFAAFICHASDIRLSLLLKRDFNFFNCEFLLYCCCCWSGRRGSLWVFHSEALVVFVFRFACSFFVALHLLGVRFINILLFTIFIAFEGEFPLLLGLKLL